MNLNLIDTVLLVIAIALLLVVGVLCVSVCMMREEENMETYDLASEFNERVYAHDLILWHRGWEVDHDGEWILVHTTWALGA